MMVHISVLLLFSLLINVQAQIIRTTADSAATDSNQTALETPIFQISHGQILPDSLVEHRDFSALNRMTHSLGKKYYRQSLVATTVVANWGAFYLKRRADNYYQQYLKAGNKNQIQKYYREATRYDNYATIALVVSGAALSAYLWFLFND